MLSLLMMVMMMRRLRILLPYDTILSHITARISVKKILGLASTLRFRRIITPIHSLTTLGIPSTLEILDDGVNRDDYDGGDDGKQ